MNKMIFLFRHNSISMEILFRCYSIPSYDITLLCTCYDSTALYLQGTVHWNLDESKIKFPLNNDGNC